MEELYTKIELVFNSELKDGVNKLSLRVNVELNDETFDETLTAESEDMHEALYSIENQLFKLIEEVAVLKKLSEGV